MESLVIQHLPAHTVLFDGACNLCNGSVQFLIKHDRKSVLKFASLQSVAGQKVLKHLNQPNLDLSTVIYYDGSKFHFKSAAALKIIRLIGLPYSIGNVFIIIPRPIRDGIYDLIARNRIKWFGRSAECMIPTESTKKLFIEDF